VSLGTIGTSCPSARGLQSGADRSGDSASIAAAADRDRIVRSYCGGRAIPSLENLQQISGKIQGGLKPDRAPFLPSATTQSETVNTRKGWA
jgi:hypothetical protein